MLSFLFLFYRNVINLALFFFMNGMQKRERPRERAGWMFFSSFFRFPSSNTSPPPSLFFARAIELNGKKMKLFSRGSAAKHDFEITLHSVSPWPVDASASDALVVSWRRGARRAGSVAAVGQRRRWMIDGAGDDSTAVALDLSGATISVPATLYKVRKGRSGHILG